MGQETEIFLQLPLLPLPTFLFQKCLVQVRMGQIKE